MAENGKKLISFVGSLLGSFLAVTYAIYQLVYAPLNSAIAAECEKRAACDKEIVISLQEILKEARNENLDTKIMLAQIQTDLKYIKAKR